MNRYDWILQYRCKDGSWESVTTPKGALEGITPGQAEAYLGQWHAAHLDLKVKIKCVGIAGERA